MDYTGPKPVPNPRIAEVVQKYLKDNNVTPKEMSNQEIVDTMLGLAINEAALMMEQGICDRPWDMDLAMIYGTGFPAVTGAAFFVTPTNGVSRTSMTSWWNWKNNTGCDSNRLNLLKEHGGIRQDFLPGLGVNMAEKFLSDRNLRFPVYTMYWDLESLDRISVL